MDNVFFVLSWRQRHCKSSCDVMHAECALILFIQTLALYKSFTYLLTYNVIRLTETETETEKYFTTYHTDA